MFTLQQDSWYNKAQWQYYSISRIYIYIYIYIDIFLIDKYPEHVLSTVREDNMRTGTCDGMSAANKELLLRAMINDKKCFEHVYE